MNVKLDAKTGDLISDEIASVTSFKDDKMMEKLDREKAEKDNAEKAALS